MNPKSNATFHYRTRKCTEVSFQTMNFRIVNFCGVFIGILMTDKSAKHTVAGNALRTLTVMRPVSVWWVLAVYCWLSVSWSRVCQWHSVQHLVQQLQRTVQMHLHPAGGVLDALPRIVRTPALHEAQAQDAQPPEIIHTNPCCCREADCRSDSTNTSWSWNIPCHRCSLCCRRRLRRGRLLLHLPVALPEVKDLQKTNNTLTAMTNTDLAAVS